MTVTMKQMARQSDSIFSTTMNEMADWIYSQMSDYANDVIKKSIATSSNEWIVFEKCYNGYVSEK